MYRFVRRALLPVLLPALLVVLCSAPERPAEARRYAAIVMDAASGEVIYARRANANRIPASLVKMMTLYLTFEALDAGRLKPHQRLKVSRTAAGRSPTKLGLRPGRTISVEDAILALITKSANDAATVLAEALAGNEPAFARLMTSKGHKLAMKRSRFHNASGLPNRRQRSTARDMALLARALQRDFPQYYHYFSKQTFKFGRKVYRNHNKLLGSYGGADGIKTGYTRASGFNVAVSAKRGQRRLIAVVIGGRTARSRDRHVARLLDNAFAKLRKRDRTAAAKRRRGPPALPIPRATAQTRPRPDANDRIVVAANWAIQVGAFRRFAAARRQVHRATSAAPSLLRGHQVSIVAIDHGRGDFYRARLTGVTERVAREACAALRRRDLECVPVPPSPRTLRRSDRSR